MKIKYGRLWTFGHFENEYIELEDEFKDISEKEALETLKIKVFKLHDHSMKLEEEFRKARQMRSEVEGLERQLEHAKEAKVLAEKEITELEKQLEDAKINKWAELWKQNMEKD